MSTPFLPEKIYHVYSHAVSKDNLFRKPENYYFFLSKYKEYIPQVAETFAFCFLPNHFHLLIRVRPETDIKSYFIQKFNTEDKQDISKRVSLQFSHLLNGYTQAYNKQFQRKGALFMSRIQRREINNDHYFSRVMGYIHVNPIKHGFVKSYHDWEFSSYHLYLNDEERFIFKDEGLHWFGGQEEFIRFHETFKQEFLNLDENFE
jgi:putative transposase